MIATTTSEQTASAGRTAPLFPDYVPPAEERGITAHQMAEVSQLGEDILKLHELARELQGAMADTVEKYMVLCQHIRDAQLMPVQVKRELSALGFADSRISEINRVSQVSDEVWSQYKARTIGFKITLELARKEKAVEMKRQAAEEEEGRARKAGELVESSNSSSIEKTKETKAVGPIAAALAGSKRVSDYMGIEGTEGVGDAFGCVNLYIPKGVNKLPSHVKPLNIFNINGWRVEVRITRAKQTGKPAKKSATKTKARKGKK